jgi:signal transduction histidine kinase
MEKHQLALAELSSLLRMIQVIPDSDSVSRVQQMLLAFCTSWHTIGTRRAVLLVVDGRTRMLRGHLAAERMEPAPDGESSFDALARRVVENTRQIESGDLTLRCRTFAVPLDWLRCGAVKAAGSGVPVLADRRLSEFASDPVFDFFATASYVAVPLRVHGRVTAVLTADNGEPGGPIGVEDISLVYSMAQQAANAIERLLDTADSARKFRVLRKLQDVLAAVDDARRFGDSLSAMLAMAARAGGATGAMAKDLVRNRSTHVKSIEELDDSHRDADLAVTECFDEILDRVAGSIKPMRGDSTHAMFSDVAAQRIHHFVAMPLVAGGECLGAVAFYVENAAAETGAAEFPGRDRLFLELCAGMLAERLDSLYRAEHVRRAERMLEEARSNWTREKVASRAGVRAQEQVDALVSGIREIRETVTGRAPFERRVERARELIEGLDADVATFRSEMSELHSSLERVDLFALAREVFEPWAQAARARGVEVTVHTAERAPALLMHRPSVRTALENILRVLAEHVDRGDRVLLEASASDDRVILLIADTAGKVDGTLLSRLFMPFVTGEEDERDPGAMSAAGDILQRHSGEITVKSSPSWKTILAISFPAASNRDRRESGRDRRHRPGDRRGSR